VAIKASQLLEDLAAAISTDERPAMVVETIESHKDNPMTLAASLHSAGHDETHVKTVPDRALASFRHQIAATIAALKTGGQINK
tara:strand:- start:1724 stop:1975 length:252 start_codon:yes stop_codon:yes gene_type:complete